MFALLLLVFLAIVAVDIWAAVAVMWRPGLGGWLRVSYWLVIVLALAGTIVMTGYFSYYADSNTRVFGWPIPRVIFQRDTPDAPWLDYIGPTIVLAYPLNFLLYIFFPSMVAVLLSRKRKYRN